MSNTVVIVKSQEELDAVWKYGCVGYDQKYFMSTSGSYKFMKDNYQNKEVAKLIDSTSWGSLEYHEDYDYTILDFQTFMKEYGPKEEVKTGNGKDAVVITSQEEFDKVSSVWTIANLTYKYMATYKYSSPIDNNSVCLTKNDHWCHKRYYAEKGYNILTFEQWEKKYTKPKESEYQIGEWVLASIGETTYVGKYNGKASSTGNYLLVDWCSEFTVKTSGYITFQNGEFTKIVRKLEPHEIPKSQDVSKPATTVEELLRTAAEKYPIGTRYIPVSSAGISGSYSEESVTCVPRNIGTTNDPKVDAGVGYVYARGVWAEVVSKSQEKRVEVFPGIYVGDVVVSLSKFDNVRAVGDLFIARGNSSLNNLYYKPDCCCYGLSNTWRKATPEEVKYYESGGKNISGMTTKTESSTSKFKVGDWVVFLVDKARGTGLYTDCWNKPYVLQVNYVASDSLQFTGKEMTSVGYKTTDSASNNANLFRHATPSEINYELRRRADITTNKKPHSMVDEGRAWQQYVYTSAPEPYFAERRLPIVKNKAIRSKTGTIHKPQKSIRIVKVKSKVSNLQGKVKEHWAKLGPTSCIPEYVVCNR